MKEKEYNFNNANQGAIVKSPAGKQRITIRIDTGILDWFRNQVHQSGGWSYHTFINSALKEYIQRR
ncbi:BrnA antitoxin family protein [candidate division KSB1 bacterium]|nr:BrnA antitoxin family protein [candidate division KSB1 bacterium]